MTRDTTPAAPAHPQTREPSGRKWPIIIISLLLLNVTVCAVTVTLALRNPAQVTPGYYDKSLNWDEERAAAKNESEPAPEAQTESND